MAEASKVKERVSLQYPILSSDNYPIWAMKMKVNMIAQGVWGPVKPKEKDKVVDERLDKMAMAAIYQAVPDSMMRQLIGRRRRETSGLLCR